MQEHEPRYPQTSQSHFVFMFGYLINDVAHNINNYQLHAIIHEQIYILSRGIGPSGWGSQLMVVAVLQPCSHYTNFLLYLLTNKLKMAELDLSGHMLNTSTSKQKFSFPKTQRFSSRNNALCDSLYEMPSTRNSRATSFGYGQKDFGLKIDRQLAPVGAYELSSEFKKDEHKGFSFGSSREQMQLSGPLKDTKLLGYIPGPGNYESNPSTLDKRASTIAAKLEDRTTKHLEKNPGPGTYQHPQMGGSLYYATSKFRNFTNNKITPGSRLAQIGRKSTIDVGPGSYTINVQDLNPQGRYKLSNHEGSLARVFGKSPRADIVPKSARNVPGPGQYGCFSSFG